MKKADVWKDICKASKLVNEQHWQANSGPYRDVVRATLAYERQDYTQATELAQQVIRALTPQEETA